MQILVSDDNLIKYKFDDDDTIIMGDNDIKTSIYCIGDLNKNNCTLYKDIDKNDIPTDFIGCAYKYIGNSFVESEQYNNIIAMVAEVELLKLKSQEII